MENKGTLFVVFAVLLQSSLAMTETIFLTELAEIQSAGINMLEAFNEIVDGFYDTMKLLANVSSGNQEYDAETISEMENIKEILAINLIKTFDYTEEGLESISGNNCALTANEDEVNAKFEELIDLVFSAFYEIPGNNCSEAIAAIGAIEQVAMPKVDDVWISVYSAIVEIISPNDLPTKNAIESVRLKGMANGRAAFGAIFAGMKILVLELFGETQDRYGTFSSAIESQKDLTSICLQDEVNTKITLFQYILTSLYTGDNKIMSDLNKIQVAELGINNAFEYACNSAFNTMIQLSTNQGVSSLIATLSNTISASLDAALLGDLVAVSYIEPEGNFDVESDQAAVHENLEIIANGITDAIKLTQESNTRGIQAEIEMIEERVVTSAVYVFEEIFVGIRNVASISIGYDAVATTKSDTKKVSVAICSAFTNILFAIKTLLFENTYETQTGCDVRVTAIETARNAAFAGVKEATVLEFDLIRIFHLFIYQKANGLSPSLRLLLEA